MDTGVKLPTQLQLRSLLCVIQALLFVYTLHVSSRNKESKQVNIDQEAETQRPGLDWFQCPNVEQDASLALNLEVKPLITQTLVKKEAPAAPDQHDPPYPPPYGLELCVASKEVQNVKLSISYYNNTDMKL